MKLNRDPNPNDLRLKVDDWIAEVLSLQPDRTLSCRVRSSWDSLALIYIISHVADLFWITDEIYRAIGQAAYVANYEGEWKTVQVFLEQNPQTPEEFYNLWCKFKSPDEFFGNLKKRAMRLHYIIKFKKRDPHGPITKAQRARGYRDKGTLRPSHQFHGDPPEKGPHLDLRSKIGHPLLKEESKAGKSIVSTNSGGEEDEPI